VTHLAYNFKVVAGGTPAYMAPELFQVSGASAMDIDLKATDIWSLGEYLLFYIHKLHNFRSISCSMTVVIELMKLS
jgi:serine/threonine protein kinase